ncbi:VOC family protein [Nocardioides seonyuensis]|uniref:VOC family protein n=1 Tax=Nocardioides seonyuensis TaxID=2518371 RepID=A0A4P7IH81_9ACTN|nr:VOC family protein [Nocardioides seonyuensis]QBX55487.1 VOC family protein [Nocardioides seonyuensis]
MASKLNPYVNVLDGKAREAAEFYQSVLGGDLAISTFGEMGTEGPVAEQVMHAQLETPAGFTLMIADAPPEMVSVTMGDNISISISGDQAEAESLRGWFAALAEGGEVRQPLEPAPWGDEFGMLVDKFGIGWMVNITGE